MSEKYATIDGNGSTVVNYNNVEGIALDLFGDKWILGKAHIKNIVHMLNENLNMVAITNKEKLPATMFNTCIYDVIVNVNIMGQYIYLFHYKDNNQTRLNLTLTYDPTNNMILNPDNSEVK